MIIGKWQPRNLFSVQAFIIGRVDIRSDTFCRIVRHEGHAPSVQELVKHKSEGIEIHGVVVGLSVIDFWCHVGDGTDSRHRLGCMHGLGPP